MTIKASSYPTSRPTLDLNFAQTKRLDPRVTFTRSSTGTYFDANGVLQSAATNTARFDHNPATGESLGLLVEEARTNSQTNSTRVELFTPVELNIIPNALLAPDGSFTACALIGNTANSNKYAVNPVGFSVSGTTHSFSFYAKSIGNRTSVIVGGTSSAWGTGSVTFDLSAVTATATGSFTGSITAAGNGWYRCVATRIANASGYGINIYLGTFQGDGVSGIGIWGLQAEAGSFPTSYIPTPATFTSRASSATYYDANGVIQTAGTNVARSAAFFPDSNGVMRPAGLLLEAAGTNLFTYSEQFDNAAWTKVVSTITQNAATAPDGTLTADRWQGDAGSAFVHNSGSSVSGTHTISMWVKAVTPGTNDQFRLVISGTVISQNFTATSAWQRFSFTGSAATSNNAHGIARNSLSQATDLYIWGAQLEASPYPTSYIPTTTATITRSADVSSSATVTRSADVASITGTNFSSWHNQGQGTLLAQGDTQYEGGTQNYVALHGSSYASNRMALYVSPAGHRAYIDPPGIAPVINGQTTGAYRVAVGYNSTNGASSFNGGNASTFNTGSISSTFTTLSISGADDPPCVIRHKRLTYWPTRLSDATLQAITL